MRINILICAFVVVLGVGSATAQSVLPEVPTTESVEPASTGVFRGEVEVSVVTLYATVIDKDRHPVSGLTADDFAVFEGDEKREITFFEAVERKDLELKGSAAQGEEELASVAAQPGGDSVAVIFDNTRLERRARRRVLKAMEAMVEPLRQQGAEVMVAVMAPKFEVIQTFDNDPELIASAFEKVANLPTMGEALKAESRGLKRDVYRGLATANAQNIQIMARGEGQRLEVRIDAFREVEMQRGLAGLNRIESLVRSLAGRRGGRTSLIWVTEDMTFRPGIEIYRRFYNRFSTFLELDLPDMWGTERDLRLDFDRVIGAAHSAGVTVHVVDASDRDSEFMDTDFGTQDPFTATASQAVGPSTRGYDFSEVNDAIEGSQYLGYGSGGDFFGNSRNFDVFVDSFVETTATYYVLGFDRPTPSDGHARSVRVEINRPGLRVRHPAKILDRTPEQRLVDSVVSHLLWGAGINPLGLNVTTDQSQNAGDGTILWPVNLEIPVVGLSAGDDGRAVVTVVLCVGATDGTIAQPQQFRMAVTVPESNPEAVGAAQVTVRTRPEGERVAVGIRDELSGATSTVLVSMTPSS